MTRTEIGTDMTKKKVIEEQIFFITCIFVLFNFMFVFIKIYLLTAKHREDKEKKEKIKDEVKIKEEVKVKEEPESQNELKVKNVIILVL